MDLTLHRVSDPRFIAVDLPHGPAAVRRQISPVDSTPEELRAQQVLELAQRDRVLAVLQEEAAWRESTATSAEPRISFAQGSHCDIHAVADRPWRSSRDEPDAAVVQVLLDATGVDEAHLQWLTGDDSCSCLFLVTPTDTTGHLPAQIDIEGRKIDVHIFGWHRQAVHGDFDPLAMEVSFRLSGPSMALREDVIVRSSRPIFK